MDSLPGFVDGVSSSPDGTSFWAAIISQATPPVLLMPRSRMLRWVAARLPKTLRPQMQPYGLVVEVSMDALMIISFLLWSELWLITMARDLLCSSGMALCRGAAVRQLPWHQVVAPAVHTCPYHTAYCNLQIAANGTVLRSLHDPTGRVCPSISSITQVGDTLFLGNLGSSWVCSLDLSKVQQ